MTQYFGTGSVNRRAGSVVRGGRWGVGGAAAVP